MRSFVFILLALDCIEKKPGFLFSSMESGEERGVRAWGLEMQQPLIRREQQKWEGGKEKGVMSRDYNYDNEFSSEHVRGPY